MSRTKARANRFMLPQDGALIAKRGLTCENSIQRDESSKPCHPELDLQPASGDVVEKKKRRMHEEALKDPS
jgi:hypothetical protein